MHLFHRLSSALGFVFFAAPAFSQGPFDGPSFSYPRENPKIAWQYEPEKKIEYKVCNDSDESVVFYWDEAKFGAAHNCLLHAGSCVVKPDLLSASSGRGSGATVISSSILDSKFDLNGSDLGDDVPTRVWCAQNGGVECNALEEGWTITSILGLSATRNYCNFEESPFLEEATAELKMSASVEEDRWRIEVGSSLDASLIVFFRDTSKFDLLVENQDFKEIYLGNFEADFSNFGEVPADFSNANFLGFTVSSEEAPYEGIFYLTPKSQNVLRPILLAVYEGRVFAIVGLGAPVR